MWCDWRVSARRCMSFHAGCKDAWTATSTPTPNLLLGMLDRRYRPLFTAITTTFPAHSTASLHLTEQTNMSNPNDASQTLAPTLTTLPHELQLAILSHLGFLDQQLMRATCKHFRYLLPQSTRANLLLAEEEPDVRAAGLLYCNPCSRLRHYSKFSTKIQIGEKKGNDRGKYKRWCVNCGYRR